MRTVTIQVLQYNELSPKAQAKAREWWLTMGLDDWWDQTYEDAEMIGVKIEEFDIDRRTIELDLKFSVGKVAGLIVDNHGEHCDTYKLAQDYYRRKRTRTPMNEECFKRNLGREYLKMLQSDYDYQTSDECAAEQIICNEYEFTADGKRFRE